MEPADISGESVTKALPPLIFSILIIGIPNTYRSCPGLTIGLSTQAPKLTQSSPKNIVFIQFFRVLLTNLQTLHDRNPGARARNSRQ
jgi:hypothetical protein